MSEFGTVTAMAAAIQTAFDAAKGLYTISREVDRKAVIAEIQSALMEAQSKALAAQADYAALSEQVGALKAEIARLKEWNREKQRYELQTRSPHNPGALAYCVKESECRGEPDHWLCPTCYEDGRKSILQEHQGPRRSINAVCPRCKTTLTFYE